MIFELTRKPMWGVALLCLGVVASCRGPAGPEGPPGLPGPGKYEGVSVVAELRSDTVFGTILNESSETIVYYLSCTELQRHEDGEWKFPTPTVVCDMAPGALVEMRPGEVRALDPLEQAFLEPGEYRYSLGLLSASGTVPEPLPEVVRISNSFVIE